MRTTSCLRLFDCTEWLSICFQPAIQEVKSSSSLNYSLAMWYNTVVVDKTSSKEFFSGPQAWVDVRDLALAHVLSLETPEAGGERILISAGKQCVTRYHVYWSYIYWLRLFRSVCLARLAWVILQSFPLIFSPSSSKVDAANSSSSSFAASHKLPAGFPGMTKEERRYHVLLDTSKQGRLLDIKFHTLKETTEDILEDFGRRGW